MKNTLEYFRKLHRLKLVTMLIFFLILSTMTVAAAANAIEDGDIAKERISSEMEVKENPEVNELENPEIILISTPILYSDIEYVAPLTAEAATNQIQEIEQCLETLEVECSNSDYTYDAFVMMQSELQRLITIKETLNADVDKFKRWEEEYYYATQTWMHLRANGCSEEVAAGILGNIMAEVSGGSLNLKPHLYSSGGHYYGLCQWSMYYRPHVADMSFEDQLDYIIETMPTEFKHYAHIYKKGFSYEQFLQMDDPKDVALAFAKVYERCGSGSYAKRQQYAMKAYNYFAGK